MPTPSILTSELPHYTPSTCNQFGSVYDVTYMAPEFGATEFKRANASGYLRNASGFGSNEAIDYNRTKFGAGKGPGDPSLWPRGPTAQSRSSMGVHKLGDEPFGTTEHKDSYQGQRGIAEPGAAYPGAGRGQGAAEAIHWDKNWQVPDRTKMPLPPLTGRPGNPNGRNATKLHTTGEPFDGSTSNGDYGKVGPGVTAKQRGELPMPMWGDNARDRLYSNAVQKCPVPSLGIRTNPEDEHNPIRLANKDAERAGISRRIENEGWVKWSSIAKSSYGTMQNYPETDGLSRCKGLNKNTRMAARGGNSNQDMFGDIQAHVIIDETTQQPNATSARLAESLTERVACPNRHCHREGYSAYSAKFRPESSRN